MRLVRVGGASLNQLPLDFQGNADRIAIILKDARRKNVDMICLPELCLTGYGCEDQFLSMGTSHISWQVLKELLPLTKDMVVVFGLPCLFRGLVYNCAVVCQDGRILGINPKKILAREGIHYEQRWFHPWARGAVSSYESVGQRIPFGDYHYRFGEIGVAIEICEEAWGSDSPSTPHVAQGIQFILNPSASHFSMGKVAVREKLVSHWSRSQKVHYCYANLVGNEAGRVIYDGGVLLAEGGDIVSRGPRLNFEEQSLTYYDFDSDLATVARIGGYGVEANQFNEKSETPAIIGTPLHNTDKQDQLNPSKVVNAIHHSGDKSITTPLLYEDFYRAEVLGMQDYLRKSGSKGSVVSLSGGVDSAVTAILVAHSFADALRSLGSKELSKRLNKPELKSETDVKIWIKSCLICVYQTTTNSSTATLDAARAVAESIHATFYEVDVEPIVQKYHSLFEEATGEALSWEGDDIAMQNIQARVRSPLAWMLANNKGMLLLSTCNRSEAALGYTTMDGDTAGGLAPLSGIDKHFLIGFLNWLGSQEAHGLGSLASVQKILARPPTAELRPPEQEQRDEDDLMPYHILERIERLFVRDRMNRREIYRCLRVEFSDYSNDKLSEFIATFMRLWRQNQWKRERYAPGFHIDDESLDPKTWCRFPILSGSNEFSP